MFIFIFIFIIIFIFIFIFMFKVRIGGGERMKGREERRKEKKPNWLRQVGSVEEERAAIDLPQKLLLAK